MNSCMVEIRIGDKVKEIRTGRIGTLKDIRLLPNSNYDGVDIIALLYVHVENSDIIQNPQQK